MLMDQDGVTPAVLTVNEAPSAPTTTTPRRMIVSSPNVHDEYVEVAPDSWRRILRHQLSFGTVTFLGHAVLSEDGRRLVFRGQDGTQIVSGYYVDRAAIDVGFPKTPIKIPTGDALSVATPFLTNDCRHFYYTDPNNGDQIRHVAL